MRKFFITADMEGCAGVASRGALLPERWAWEWTAARRWITQEVVAVAKAALDGGYDMVVVSDSHGNAHNIDPDLLPDRVGLVRSWPRPMLQMQGIEDEDVIACAFIGYHAAASQLDSILAHTYSGAAIRSLRLNGEVCSEGYLNAALAGAFGKPVILISGDQHVVEDAARYAPDALTFVSKQSIGWSAQQSLPPSEVCRALGERAIAAFQQPLPSPFVVNGPFDLDLEMTSQTAAELLAFLPGMERTGAWSIRSRFESLESVMRFVSFAILYTPTGATAF